ncbi:MAG: S4 domain-containing protein [Evtepia sp.]
MTLTPLPLDQLTPTPGETKEVRATVASVRLDAVVSAGFSIPRSRAADLIRGGRVMVNHRPCERGG